MRNQAKQVYTNRALISRRDKNNINKAVDRMAYRYA